MWICHWLDLYDLRNYEKGGECNRRRQIKKKPFKISIIPHYTKIQLFPSFKIFPSWSHPYFYLIFRQNNHHFFGTFRDIKYSSQSSWHLSLHLSLVLSFAYVLIPLFFLSSPNSWNFQPFLCASATPFVSWRHSFKNSHLLPEWRKTA